MFKKLLVPVDSSPLAEQALGRAAAIARAADAAIDVVIVHELAPVGGYLDAPWNASEWTEEHTYVESLADELASGAGRTVTHVTHGVLTGGVADMICRRAVDMDADLIVMSSHSRTGLTRFCIGSVAEGVLRHAHIPVLILHPDDTKIRRAAAHHLPAHILVPVADSPFSRAIIPVALDLARCSNARVSLLQVVEPVPAITPEAGIPTAYAPVIRDEPETRRMADEAKQQLGTLARQLHDQSGLVVDAHVVIDGGAASAILGFAAGSGIDAIAMSTHARGASRLLLGSVADKVLRTSGLPTLLMPRNAVRPQETASTATAATQGA